jgi:SAM-dependent methyltransferase
MPGATKRFSDRVSFYVRSRPKYPEALLRFFQTELGLSPTDAVADIGSGTGFLTELFVRNGNPTFAVEPNDEMRAAGENYLARFPNFHSINGTAEATTLPDSSMRFVVAGQAFHWFDPPAARKEFFRILIPGGVVALIWNERRLNSPFIQKYDELIERYRVERSTDRVRDLGGMESSKFKPFFATNDFESRTFDNPQILDREGLMDRLSSSSYMPLPSHPKHAQMLKAANELFDAYQEKNQVVIAHDTRVYFGKLTA